MGRRPSFHWDEGGFDSITVYLFGDAPRHIHNQPCREIQARFDRVNVYVFIVVGVCAKTRKSKTFQHWLVVTKGGKCSVGTATGNAIANGPSASAAPAVCCQLPLQAFCKSFCVFTITWGLAHEAPCYAIASPANAASAA